MEHYMIICYSKGYIDDESTPSYKHIFTNLNKREVVGILKTIMDNFDPEHVDIFDPKAFQTSKGEEIIEQEATTK